MSLNMAEAHRRRKDPDGVRRALLDSATTIVAERGLADLTVAAVAIGAGVTKGAIFHHFENRQAVVEAMMDDLIERFGKRVDGHISADPVRSGRFTRAYVVVATGLGEDDRNVLRALSAALTPGNELYRKWYAWLEERLREHRETDAGLVFETVRLATDGIWLMAVTRDAPLEIEEMRDHLLAMTASE